MNEEDIERHMLSAFTEDFESRLVQKVKQFIQQEKETRVEFNPEERIKRCRTFFHAFKVDERLSALMLYSLMVGGKRIRLRLFLAALLLFIPQESRKKQALQHGGVGHTLIPMKELFYQGFYEAWKKALFYHLAALECVHTYSLVHDDLPCMDNDAWRRFFPTVHILFDEAQALLVGDALLNYTHRLLIKAEQFFYQLKPETPEEQMLVLKSLRYLHISSTNLQEAASHHGMILGQVCDLALTEAYIEILQEKKKSLSTKEWANKKEMRSVFLPYFLSLEHRQNLIELRSFLAQNVYDFEKLAKGKSSKKMKYTLDLLEEEHRSPLFLSENEKDIVKILFAMQIQKTGRLLMAALSMGASFARILCACRGGTWFSEDLSTKEHFFKTLRFSQVEKILQELGLHLGIAFQLKDDLLDKNADFSRLGKSAGKDEKDSKFSSVNLLGQEKTQALLQLEERWIDKYLEELLRRNLETDKLEKVLKNILMRSF